MRSKAGLLVALASGFAGTPPTGVRLRFLGDSTTHAHEVSSGDALYDVVEEAGHGKFSVWAAGVGGYGNLQERLLLQRVYDEVRPDIVVWQLDGNDILNTVPDEDDAYGAISRRRGASDWPGVAGQVAGAAVRTTCAPLDTHWNRDRNRVAGEILAARLTETPPTSLSASAQP